MSQPTDWHQGSHFYNWQPFIHWISLQGAFWRNEKDILSMPQMNATTNQIKLDFRVSKAYQASTEDWLSKFQACRTITWYKKDTDNWHFDSCRQLYLTQETLLLKQFNILYYGNLLHFRYFFSLCLQKETGMICLREAPKGTPLVISTWWAPVIAAIEVEFFFPIL